VSSYPKIAEALLRHHEGLSLKPYHCTAGKQTIGFGRNLDDKGITADEAAYLLHNDIVECEVDLMSFGYWQHLNDNQKAGLIDLRFCVGANGFRSFRRMKAALGRGDYQQAASEVLDSKFATQTGNRAQDIADLLTLEEGAHA